MKDWLPEGTSVELEASTGWQTADEPLRAAFRVDGLQLGTPTGHRLLLPLGILHASKKHPFQHARRVYPIYFPFPYETVDDISIQLPPGYRVESLPASLQKDSIFGRYEMSSRNEDNMLRLGRRLVIGGYLYPVKAYAGLRAFFDAVQSGDDEQLVLQLATEPGQN